MNYQDFGVTEGLLILSFLLLRGILRLADTRSLSSLS